MQSLFDLCEGSERAPGVQVEMQWWEQVGIDLEGAREAAAATEEGGGGEEGWREGKENSRGGAKVRVQRSDL